jgi:cell division protease FtsH
VHKISIIPRGIGALGYTIQRPTEDRYLMTREELENKMAVLLGGRAAEHLVYGHLSTGAADDLSKTTDIARNMVTRFGMGGKLGPVTYESDPNVFLAQMAGTRRLYAEDTAREIDVAVREIVSAQFERARGILARNRALLDESAKALLQKETLADQELAAVLGKVAPEPVPVPVAAAATAR